MTTDNVIKLNPDDSGSRGFIRSKSGSIWEYTPQTCGNEPRLVQRGSKYTNDKRKEDNERVKRQYKL